MPYFMVGTRVTVYAVEGAKKVNTQIDTYLLVGLIRASTYTPYFREEYGKYCPEERFGDTS